MAVSGLTSSNLFKEFLKLLYITFVPVRVSLLPILMPMTFFVIIDDMLKIMNA